MMTVGRWHRVRLFPWASGRIRSASILIPALMLVVGNGSYASDLFVGRATVNITPNEPVALTGQMHTRIATSVETPITATALALESRDGDTVLDQAIMVSCDLVAIRGGILEEVRRRVGDMLPDFDARKIFLSATHTHTGPVLVSGAYHLPDNGVTRPADYVDQLADRVAEASATAWKNRTQGSAGWGLGYAAVAVNRRAVYSDGHAQMYGKTDRSDFRAIEGYEDHGVEVLFFWDQSDKLMATAINIACPAQEVGNRRAVNADFWHPVRDLLQQSHGEDVAVLAWIGAAGDQSPHLMYRKAADDRMRKLRGLSRLDEIARRIFAAWEEAYAGAIQDRRHDLVMNHRVETIELPERIVSEQEIATIAKQVRELSEDPTQQRKLLWHQSAIDRYHRQQAGDVRSYAMEMHAIRLGDVAIATNHFELFTDFGIQIKSRSPALQTFIIQLAGPGTYIPSQRAEIGGGYSATVESNEVGSDGGQVLVEQTLRALKSLWQ